MRNRVIRTDGFAFSTFDTFLLIDDRLAVDHGNRAFGADLHTGMRHAAPAHIGDNIFIGRTGRAGRGDHLHKRRFIIFLVDIAGSKAVGKMHRLILRAERKSHCKTDPFAGDRALTVNTVTVFRPFLNNFIWDGLDIMDQSLVRGLEPNLRDSCKNFMTYSFYRSVKISHHNIFLLFL